MLAFIIGVASRFKETDAIFYTEETTMDYDLAEGYKIVSLKDNLD